MLGTKLALALPNVQDITTSAVLSTGLVFALIVSLAYVVITELYRRNVRLASVPGPRGLPIVGNFYQLGRDPAETLHIWGQQYRNGIFQIMLGNMPVVVFNSMQAARDVFIGQGHSLIDKPVFYTFHSVLSSVASSIGTTPWSESTKKRRKTAMGAMNRPGVATYLPFIDEITKSLLSDLLSQGKGGEIAFDPKNSISRTVTDLTMTLNYGARLPLDEGLLEEIIDAEDELSRVKTPLGSSQDFIPILRLMPFNTKSSRARETNRRRLAYLNRFSREMKERMENGTEKACIQVNCIKDEEVKLDEIDLMGISMSMVSGGLDTMVNTLAWAMGTLALRPDIQEKAYDAIVEAHGTESWGTTDDETGVPYINALVKECLRVFSVLRLSLPRRTWRDVQYDDIFIPKGTTVFLNAWGCNRDEAVYGPDKDKFRPERFLDDPDLPHAAYGFGTRMCAGFHLANRQSYIFLLRLIWSFKIERSLDPRDNHWTMDPLTDVTEPWHIAAIPPSYKIRLVPRNLSALQEMLKG